MIEYEQFYASLYIPSIFFKRIIIILSASSEQFYLASIPEYK